MSVSDMMMRVEALLEKKNLRRADLCRGIGTVDGTVRKWIAGSAPSVETAYKIAQYLGVTVEYLLTGEIDGTETPTDAILTESELKLLDDFRHIPPQEQQTISLMVDAIRQKCDQNCDHLER